MTDALSLDMQLGKLIGASVNIRVSMMLPIRTQKRMLPARQWHGNRGTGRYAQRVNKKWLKRYGLNDPVHILRTAAGFFVSQYAYEQIHKLAK